MKTMNLCILILGAVALTACGDSGGSSSGNTAPQNMSAPGVESDGRCSSATIYAHEDIRFQTNMYNSTKNQSYLQRAQNACNKFKSLVEEQSCTAVNSYGSPTTVSKSTVAAICAEVAGLLRPPAPAPTGDTRELKSLKDGFSITVKGAASINELLTAADSAFLQKGKVIRSIYSLDRNKPFCFLEKKDASLDVRADDVLKMTNLQLTGTAKIAVLSSDLKVQMGCAKKSSNEWVMQDLIDLFGSTAEVKVIEAAQPATPEESGAADADTGSDQ